jgi:thiamine biosynthesis lipoprotein
MLNGKQRIALYVIGFFMLCWLSDYFIAPKEIGRQSYVLHTLTEIKVISGNERRGQKAVNAAFDRLKELEEKFNYFDPHSELSKLNRSAYQEAVPLSDDMYNILKLALEGSEISEGAFDITVTPITRLYGFGTDTRQVPARSAVQNALTQVSWRNVQLDAEHKTARFLNRGTLIDLGGLAKGYAVDAAVEVLKQHGIKNGLLNAGGNIYALGRNHGKKWRVGIRNPRATTDVRADPLQVIELSDQACATSGDYEQYFLDSDHRYAHIFNPRTGRPANLENGAASVTVIADTAARADLLSTACFVLGEKKANELIPEQKIFYTP